MSGSGILTSSVRDFFRGVVEEALFWHDVTPSGAATDYLIDLLCTYATQPMETLDLPLGKLLLETRHCALGRRIQALKLVGDQSLYLAGYFGEYLQRRTLDVDYYAVVGGDAYRRLSTLVRRRKRPSPLADLYGELAAEFRQWVEVLAGVRQETQPVPQDLGALYAEWLQTRAPTLRRTLERAGFVFPAPGEDAN